MEEVPKIPRNSKAQIELVLEDDGTVTIVLYDPLIWENWKGHSVLEMIEQIDTSDPIIRMLTTIVSGMAYMPNVHKIKDVRTGTELDVSTRDFTKDVIGGLEKKSFKDSYIRDLYDERVKKGVIDETDFPFEEFLKDFKDHNQ